MSGFFGVLKTAEGDNQLHSIFITGVTKFAKTSLFSGLNNLNDLFVDPSAASLLGYTEQELKDYFFEYIKNIISIKKNISIEHIFDTIKDWYNGYRFSKDNIKVYNPYSVLHFLHSQEFSNYWLETGTPGFLIQLMRKQQYEIENIETTQLSSESLGTFEIDELPVLAILFQTGYITIADYDDKTNQYRMTYPNKEVRTSFKQYIVTSITQRTKN